MNFAFIKRRPQSQSSSAHQPDRRHKLGRKGERAAARFLKRRRYHVLTRNYRCSVGEIDLVCRDGATLVFVEVKSRSSDEAADLTEALRHAQRARIVRAARHFIATRNAHGLPCRFDVVTVLWPVRGAPTLEHFEDAFQPGRR